MRRSPGRFLCLPLLAGLLLGGAAGCEDGERPADRPGASTGTGGSGTAGKGGDRGGEQRPTRVQGIPTATGTHRLTLAAGGPGQREYLLHVPPSLTRGGFAGGRPERRAPLVLAMHGGLSDMTKMERLTGFSRLSDREGFLVAYPNGFLTSWNAGGCCGAARLGNVDDTGFLTRLIDKLVEAGFADPDRIYATGFSNGAGMALRLACTGPGRIAAVGSVSGSQLGACAPDRPVSVMIVHGTADRSVPFNGGGDRDFNDERPFPAVSTVAEFWRRTARLPGLRSTARSARTARRLDGGSARCRTAGKGGGTEVAFCAIAGGGHRWPPAAATALWDFFAAHPRGG